MTTSALVSRGLLAALALFVGCSCDSDPQAALCPAFFRPGQWLGTDCLSAMELAIRDSPNLAVSQDEIDWHLDVYQRGFLPLDGILGHPPTPSSWSGSAIAQTTATEFTSPWLAGEIRTGVVAIDDVLSRAYIDTIEPLGTTRGPYFSLRSSSHVTSSQNVAAAMSGVPGLGVTAARYVAGEGYGASEVFIEDHPEIDDAVYVVYRLGWGDCMVQCSGQFSWRVRVTPTTADVVAAWGWGEPVPPEILELWKQPNPSR